MATCTKEYNKLEEIQRQAAELSKKMKHLKEKVCEHRERKRKQFDAEIQGYEKDIKEKKSKLHHVNMQLEEHEQTQDAKQDAVAKQVESQPLTGVAFWEAKLYDTIYTDGFQETHISAVMEVLNEADVANFPIDVDWFYSKSDDMNWLNTILFQSIYNTDDEDDLNDLKKLLLQSKKWKRYWCAQDKQFYSPLSWIARRDEKAAMKLLPFFKENVHKIDTRERKIIEQVWDKLKELEHKQDAKRSRSM